MQYTSTQVLHVGYVCIEWQS